MHTQNIIKQPELAFTHYALFFTTKQTIKLPVYPGSAWRGAFGNALKKTVCIIRNTPCQACLLKSTCAYSYVFETPPPENTEKMRKYTAAPHPFVIQLSEKRQEEEVTDYQLNLVLFGHAQRFLPYFVHAFQKAGDDGIGGKRQVFTLEKIKQQALNGEAVSIYQHGKLSLPKQQPESILPEMPESLSINIHTPLRIKQNGKNLGPETFNFAALFSNLLRRISMLSYFHTDTPLETDFAGLSQIARQITFKSKQLQWYDWKRYSSRQQTEMQMGGVVGSLQLDMSGLEELWPYLWLGQWTHAGKGTSMGMGHYSLTATSLSDH